MRNCRSMAAKSGPEDGVGGHIALVGTPIGNLEDITLRAVRILREADVIACEDTLHTLRLLNHLVLSKPLVSYHDHNESERAVELVARAQAGERVAVVSDAGMPGISDPGYRVVGAALAAGVPVIPVPGPTAAATALAASGLPTDAYRFCGFPPVKSGARRALLASLADEKATLVFYEGPHRLTAFLDDLEAELGAREIVVARELTKLHEEFVRGTAGEVRDFLRANDKVRGEICVLVRGAVAEAEGEVSAVDLRARVAALEADGAPRMAAIKQAAKERGLSKREAYGLLLDETGE